MEKVKDTRSLITRSNGHRITTMATGKTTITNHTMVQKSSGETVIIIIEVHIRETINTRISLKTTITRITNMLIVPITSTRASPNISLLLQPLKNRPSPMPHHSFQKLQVLVHLQTKRNQHLLLKRIRIIATQLIFKIIPRINQTFKIIINLIIKITRSN